MGEWREGTVSGRGKVRRGREMGRGKGRKGESEKDPTGKRRREDHTTEKNGRTNKHRDIFNLSFNTS